MLIVALPVAGCGGDDEPSADAPQTVTVTEPQPPATTQAQGDTERSAASRPVSRSRAIAIARKRVGGGRVDEVERDDEDGRAAWKVKLARAGGVEHKVSVAVSNGRVLQVETDRDDRDDGED
ncbi:MAG TPA: PepSY domain-containing protein [Solirubrobacteraceae bacterium]|nr:PepSY domain-containing protein [Solirubrobacteraceae bacterium]